MSRPWWHREALTRRRPHLAVRTRLIRSIRAWFESQDFVEIDTPALQISPGLEPHLIAFETEWRDPAGGRQRRYLHTSPEFTMKKLLAGGVERPFQIAHVYRNGERGSAHSPEFTMLEWYRAGEPYTALMIDCAALLRLAAEAGERSRFSWRGQSCDPFAEPERLTVPAAFERYAGIDLIACLEDTPRLAAACRALGLHCAPDDRWDDLFFRILLARIEPHLGMGRATILTDYPVAQAALARPKPEEPRLAERFELYACGLELANAFGELTDPVLQRVRFEADMDMKESLYGERYPIDPGFLAALAEMPDAAGAALGLDRLAMLAAGVETIDQVLWAPVE